MFSLYFEMARSSRLKLGILSPAIFVRLEISFTFFYFSLLADSGTCFVGNGPLVDAFVWWKSTFPIYWTSMPILTSGTQGILQFQVLRKSVNLLEANFQVDALEAPGAAVILKECFFFCR